MIVAALPGAAALVQALIGADPTVAPDPAAGVAGADFAMMMAGLGTPPPPPAATAADGVEAASADDTTRGKDPDDDDAAPSQDAALLAMLAMVPQPPVTGTAGASVDVQVPATISRAARAAVAAPAVAPPTTPDSASAAPNAAPAAAQMPDAATAKGARKLPAVTVAAVQAPEAAPADARPAAPAAKAAAALKLDPTLTDPLAAPADIAAVVATIIPGTRPAAAKPAKAADAGTPDAPAPVAAPASAQPASAVAAIATLAPAMPADPPRPLHATAAQGTLGAALGEQRLSLAQGSGWLDQLARDIASTAGVEGKLHFRLNPEHLGSLHVEVTRGAAGAAVRLTADTQDARDILVDAQPQLVAEARAQGVRIAGTHVDLGGGAASDDSRRQAQGLMPQVRAIGAAMATTEPTEPRGAASERYA